MKALKVKKINKNKVCPNCEKREIKDFIHMCPQSSNTEEISGCPWCDDKCGCCE